MTVDGEREQLTEHLRLDPDATTGEALAVRSIEGYIAGGQIDCVNTERLSPGSWVATITDPTVWEITDDKTKAVQLDHGPTVDYRYYDDYWGLGTPDDWDGPSVDLGVGHDTEQLELRLPEPTYDSKGVRFYTPKEVGQLVDVSVGGIVDPATLLKNDERLPGDWRVDQ